MKKGMLILLAVFGLLVSGCTETTKTSVTVSFDSNGGQGSMKEIVVESGSEATLPANTFTRDGYTFKGWNEAKDGTGKAYADKAGVKPTANMTLYAQWEVLKVDITFHSNPPAGSGAVDTETKQTVAVGQEVTLEAPDVRIDGYTLSGWAKDKTAEKIEYSNGDKITVSGALTLYAVWEANSEGGESGTDPTSSVFEINNESNTTGTYENETVTLPFTKVGDWTWPDNVTVSAAKDGAPIEGASLNQDTNTVTITDTLTVGNYTYTVTFSADGYEDLLLTWTVAVADSRPVIEGVTVTLTPSDRLISGETVTVALTGTGTDGVAIENTVQVTGGSSAELTLSGSAFTVPAVSGKTTLTLQFTLTKADYQNAIQTISVTVYPAGHVRYDNKIFSLAKGFDFTQTAEVQGTKVATSDNYNNRAAITGAEGGYHFDNTKDTRIYLELQGVSFDLMTVNLKWANSGQPNFVVHGADAGAYGYQFYKASNDNKGWFLNGGWFDSTENSVTYSPAPAADTFHTFRVFDRGDGNRSSQLNDEAIVGYSFTNSWTLSNYTATRDNGNGMFLQFGNDSGNRNFTVKSINFYSEVTE